MEKNVLKKVVENLRRALESSTIYDSRIGGAYAEYYVAYKLAQMEYDVQLGKELATKKFDVYLPKIDKKIEVKSGKAERGGYVDFSFTKGSQLENKKFHYCVCIELKKIRNGGYKIGRNWVMSYEEMMCTKRFKHSLLTRGRKIEKWGKGPKKDRKIAWSWVHHCTTNPCLLYIYKNLDTYTKTIPLRTWVEMDIHRHPHKYRNRWDKIA